MLFVISVIWSYVDDIRRKKIPSLMKGIDVYTFAMAVKSLLEGSTLWILDSPFREYESAPKSWMALSIEFTEIKNHQKSLFECFGRNHGRSYFRN